MSFEEFIKEAVPVCRFAKSIDKYTILYIAREDKLVVSVFQFTSPCGTKLSTGKVFESGRYSVSPEIELFKSLDCVDKDLGEDSVVLASERGGWRATI